MESLKKSLNDWKIKFHGGTPRRSKEDRLLWNKAIGSHSAGKFSMAVVQANAPIEDQSQVETGRGLTFVGVYDGHGRSPAASTYVLNHLFENLGASAHRENSINETAIREAFATTERDFLDQVSETPEDHWLLRVTGCCCLVGVIWSGILYVANLGDSRAVLGTLDDDGNMVTVQLTRDHNVNNDEVRHEVEAQHPNDPTILVRDDQGVWRIKDKIEVSRSIGSAYLKDQQFVVLPRITVYQLPDPIVQPCLTAVPEVHERTLTPRDKFVIFASHGFWAEMENEDAVEVVNNFPDLRGVAKELAKKAVRAAATRHNIKYKAIKKLRAVQYRLSAAKQGRIARHDDITVIVVFLDPNLVQNNNRAVAVPALSVHGYKKVTEVSDFSEFPAPP